MTKKRLLTVSCMAIALNACAVGPDFTQPASKTAGQWDGKDSSISQKSKNAYDAEWWKKFNDPTLVALVEAAHKNSPTLQIAGVRIFQARAQLNISKGDIFPQTQTVTGSLDYQRLGNNTTNPEQNSIQNSLGFNLSWELDFWGKYRRGIQANEAAFYSSTAAYDDALVTLIADVSTTYINIRVLEERLRVAENNVKLQTESFRITNVRYKNGETSQLDTEQASTQLNQTASTIPQLTGSLKEQKNTLALLLGETPDRIDSYLGKVSTIPQVPEHVFIGVPKDLLRRRPDVRKAEYDAATQSANIGVAKAALYPSFSLNGFFGSSSSDTQNASLNDVFKWDNIAMSGGGSFLFPIFNYGRLTNQVRVQDAVFQEAVLNYQNIVLTAQKEVEDGLAQYHYSGEQAGFLLKATKSSKEAVRLSILQYKSGQTDFTTVLNAAQAELENEDSYVSTKGNVLLGLIATYRALGGGWEIHNDQNVIPQKLKESMQARTNWGHVMGPTLPKSNPLLTDKP